jgi:hypothetical protein
MKHRVLAVSVALALALVTAGAFASQRHGDPSKGPPGGAGSVTKPGAPPAGGAPTRQQEIRIDHVVIDLGTSTPVPGAPPASDSGTEHGRVPSVVPMNARGLSGSSHAADAWSSHKSDDDDDRDEGHGHRDSGHHGDDCDDDDDDDEGCGAPGDLSGMPTAVMPTKTATTPAGGGGAPTATPTAPLPSPTHVAATPTATPTVRTCGSTPPPPEPCP